MIWLLLLAFASPTGRVLGLRVGGFVPPPKISAAAKVDLQILPVPLATLNVATSWIEQDIVAPITAGASYAARVGNQVWVTGVRIKAVIGSVNNITP